MCLHDGTIFNVILPISAIIQPDQNLNMEEVVHEGKVNAKILWTSFSVNKRTKQIFTFSFRSESLVDSDWLLNWLGEKAIQGIYVLLCCITYFAGNLHSIMTIKQFQV